jgi:cytoskeletal protein RodZ
MTNGTFGEHLKRERELRAVSLDEISAATRISTRFLQAIENEQWDQLPGGVFNRGFVRAVARYLGLDEEDTVAEYASAAGDHPTVPVWTGRPPAVTPDQHWLAWALVAVIALTLAMGAWFAARRIFAWVASRRAARVTVALTPELTTVASLSGSVPAAAKVPLNSPPEALLLSGASVSSPSPVAGSAAPIAATFELQVEAGETTTVTVDADAHRVFEGTMNAGEGHTFTAHDKFQVATSDAGALLLRLNGNLLAPIGVWGQEGKVTLTRESLKGIVGGGH